MKKKNREVKTKRKPLVTLLGDLCTAGYRTRFKATIIGLLSLSTMNMYKANEIKVRHFYKYEDETELSDCSVIYAIETKDGEKGTLINGYGKKRDALVTEYMANVVNIPQQIL